MIEFTPNSRKQYVETCLTSILTPEGEGNPAFTYLMSFLLLSFFQKQVWLQVCVYCHFSSA